MSNNNLSYSNLTLSLNYIPEEKGNVRFSNPQIEVLNQNLSPQDTFLQDSKRNHQQNKGWLRPIQEIKTGFTAKENRNNSPLDTFLQDSKRERQKEGRFGF